MTCLNCQARPPMQGHRLCEQCHTEEILRGADWTVDVTGTRDDEETVLSACMLGQMTPAELRLPWRAFSGYRVGVWRALCHHYGDVQAGVIPGPAIKAIELFMAHTLRVRSPDLEHELRALRWARGFTADEYVVQAAERLLSAARRRDMSRALADVAIRLQCGAVTCEVAREEVRALCG